MAVSITVQMIVAALLTWTAEVMDVVTFEMKAVEVKTTLIFVSSINMLLIKKRDFKVKSANDERVKVLFLS